VDFRDRLLLTMAELPGVTVVDRGLVIDALLDVRNDADDHEREAVERILSSLPAGDTVDRRVVMDALLDLFASASASVTC
jgi:hypothetical protein